MIQANDGGANVSTDGGRTWSTQMNQVTSEIYGVWMDNEFPYKVYGAQQDNSTLIITSSANPFNREDFRGGPGCETGPIMPHPTRSEHRVRQLQGPVRVDEPEDRAVQAVLGRRAVALRQLRAGSDSALPAHDADGDVAARSGDRVLRIAASASHARQGRDVGKDLAGSDGVRSVLPGRERRADHARRDGRGVLQHAVRDHRVAARARRDLDGRERRAVLRDARQRQDLDERHAEGPGASRADAWRGSTPRRIAAARRTSRSIAICSATTRRTSIAPTTTARRGRG